MALEQDFQTDVWMMRRLQEVNRAPNLDPVAGAYLAASDLDDDELESATEPFGAEFQKSGWGLSEVFQDLLSRDPKKVPTEDISKLQKNLVDQGYLPPGHAADGVWDPASNSAFRRFDRDNNDQVRSGEHWLAAPVETGLRALAYTLPSGVLRGIVGAAKGFIEQTPETAERAGLAGGALAGGAIGATVGSVIPGVGTALVGGIGALIGGGVGFLADIFGEDTEENEGTNAFVDALSPFEEYRAQGSKAFFEDLGWVLTASSLIKGGGMAIGGAAKGISAGQAGGFLTRTPAVQPGLIARATGAGIGKVSKSAGVRFTEMARTHGLIAQTSRPMLQTVNGAFSGLAAGQIGARLAGGLGSGEETTTIERAIKEGPTLPRWVDDTVGLVVFSNRFLPISGKETAQGFQSLLTRGAKTGERSLADVAATGESIVNHMQSGVALKPYIHVAQENNQSVGAAKEQVLKALGADDLERATSDLWLRLDHGIGARAGEMMHELGYVGDEVKFEQSWTDAVFDVKKKLKTEWGEGKDDLTKDLLRYSFGNPENTAAGPMAFAASVKAYEGIGSSIERMAGFRIANKSLAHINRDIREGVTSVQIRDGAQGFVEEASKAFRTPTNFDIRIWRSQRDAMKSEITKLEAAIRKSASPTKTQQLSEALTAKSEQLDTFTKARPTTKRLKKDQPFSITIARNYDPDNGVPGYLTEQDLLGLADEYDRTAQQVTSAFDAAKGSADPAAWKAFNTAQDNLNQFAQDLRFRNAIGDKGLPAAQAAVPSKAKDGVFRTSDLLREKSKYHAKEAILPEGMGDQFAELGYKTIATPDDILLWDEVDNARQALEITGVGDYTRRAAFFETIGASPYKHTDRSLYRLRVAHEEAELANVALQHKIKLTGKLAHRRIADHLVEFNHGEGVQTFGPWVAKPGEGKLRDRVSLYRIDDRELSPDDIVQALKLDDIAGITDVDKVADDFYQALKRGAALGAETNLRRPIEAAHGLARAMRVNGLPGFSDFMRTFHIESPARAGALVGAGAGAGIAAAEEEASLGDIAKGAGVGLAVGAGLGALIKHRFPEGTYGYLPDKLHKLNMALRYSLSPTFDAGRYVEQNMLAVEHGLPVIVQPKNYIMKRSKEWGESPDEAWRNAINFFDEVNGTKSMRVVDDVDRRMFQKGMLGFSPRYHEAAQMYLLKKMGKSNGEIERIVSSIGRYGVGRTGVEKSINFIFFPASFSKKLIGSLGNFIMQAPARNLMIHESLRMLHGAGADEAFGDFLEKHVPMAEQLKRINNLSYGLSPGRFVLEGVGDQKTDFGKAAQIVTSFFVPSGAATPVAQAAGGLSDALTHLFVPIAVTGEDVDGLDDIVNRYVPIGRDIKNFWEAGAAQVTALRGKGEPYYQLQHYLDDKRAIKTDLEPFALALGYASVDGFLQSEVGMAFKAQVDVEEQKLARKYPVGFAKSQEFTNDIAINAQALADLAAMPSKSKQEEDIVRLAEIEQTGKLLGQVAGLDSSIVQGITQTQMRKFGLERADDRRFVDLWDRFWANIYGPIARVEAA